MATAMDNADDTPTARFIASNGTAHCQVQFSPDTNGDKYVKVEMFGDDHALADLVRDTLAMLPKEKVTGSKAAERVDSAAHAARAMLQDLGLTIEDLPAGDFEFRLEVDMDTGRAVGQSKKLHELANMPPDLVQKIHQSVVGALQAMTSAVQTDVERLVAKGDHGAAFQAVDAGWGTISVGVAEESLLDVLMKIDASQLAAESRERLRTYRVALCVRHERYDLVEEDAARLLNENPALRSDIRISAENVRAIAVAKAGHPETALAIWRGLLKNPEDIHSGERAWIWRNISKTLAPTDPEAVKAARLSVDAFLQVGDKKAALATLQHVSGLLEHQSLQASLDQYDAMLALVGTEGAMSKEVTAAIHHAKANRLRESRAHERALAAALKAVELRRGLTGVDEQLISSLHLASMEAISSGDTAKGAQLDLEAKALEQQISSAHFSIGRRMAALGENFDSAAANSLLAEARATGDPDLAAGVAVSIAVNDPALDSIGRLRKLEGALKELKAANPTSKAEEAVLLAIAQVLGTEGEHARAVPHLRRALDVNPLSLSTRDALIDALWLSEDWASAAIFLADLIQRNGEAPGLLYAYGRSLLEAGDASKAVTALQKSQKLADAEGKADLKEAAQKLRDEALDLGGTLLPYDKLLQPVGPVLREEVEQALADFAQFIAAEKRMRFWQVQEDHSHKWTLRPEQKAQDLLHTFVRARFAHRVAVFEEVNTGAGRLDVLLRFEGGLAVIIELKMCGAGYPSSYATAGEGQICHYMENRGVHLGYLVVLDGRLEKYGEALLPERITGASTISEVFVDVRPRVSERKKSATKTAAAPAATPSPTSDPGASGNTTGAP